MGRGRGGLLLTRAVGDGRGGRGEVGGVARRGDREAARAEDARGLRGETRHGGAVADRDGDPGARDGLGALVRVLAAVLRVGGLRRALLRPGERLVRLERGPEPVGVGLDDRDALALVPPGDGDELRVVQVDVLEREGEGEHLVGGAESGVDGHRAGRGLGQRQEPGGREALLLHLLQERRHERLLPLDAADVGAVADAVPQPHVVERALAGDLLEPLVEDKVAAGGPLRAQVALVDVVGQADGDAADDRGQLREAVEVDDDGVVDAEPGELLDGVLRAGRVALLGLAHGERRVEHRVRLRLAPAPVGQAAAGDLDERVAGDGDGDGVPVVGVDVEQEGGVGAADVALAAAEFLVLAGARVRADDEDVLARPGVVGPVLRDAALVEGADVTAELEPHPAEASAGEDGEGGEHAEPPEEPGAATPAGPPGPGPPAPRPGRRSALRGRFLASHARTPRWLVPHGRPAPDRLRPRLYSCAM
ncbi:putative transcriptional regulator [Streptomyces sp. Tu6071]|nr:putative transcriptional regulator [Streptomyces sp. Tu6071]